ncbi:hypothetical protein [Bradyrhizobium liaoningense]|uniref:hypothetical protein n=1 Tax=Bradyrhizobium liaoningense TaxID=43992 RepID=UPI001BA93DF3|nr:hypothetical protein [Bradyrhizobium liaoningense]MBR0903507.1 hypothetical protein [Bradyrhizobium liaoningense]
MPLIVVTRAGGAVRSFRSGSHPRQAMTCWIARPPTRDDTVMEMQRESSVNKPSPASAQ